MTKYIKSFEKALFAVAVILAIFAGSQIMFRQKVNIARADLPESNYLPAATFKYFSTAVGTTTGQTILATSTARQYAVISNDGSSAVFLFFSAIGDTLTVQNPTTVFASGTQSNPFSTSTPKVNYGIFLAASSTYEIAQNRNMYFGPMSAVALTGTTTISVVASQ